MVTETIDDGSPAYDPKTQRSVREWVEEERTRETLDGPQTYTARVAHYTIEPLPITADTVRAEAQRRIMALVGATAMDACIVRQLNANMRANELNDIRHDREWTPAEAAEAAALRGLAEQIKAIRAASNVLEPTPPSDFADNRHWP